jgi:cadmium resistance protein CadD (predicted permease)
MNNLMLILLLVFAGVALMVVLGERFAKPADPEQMQKISRWIMPLVGLALMLSMLKYYWN